MKNKKYQVLIFDLDGTLINSKKGILEGYRHALEKMGVQTYDPRLLLTFLGPPLYDNFRKHFFPDDSSSVEMAANYYKEYMRNKGKLEVELIPGVREMIQVLFENKYSITLATSKVQEFADGFLEQFHIHQYFSFVVGANPDGTCATKKELIGKVLENFSTFKKSEFVMIGDREHDMIGARENGIDSIGVLYGYGNEKELKDAGATMIVQSVKELTKVFKSN